MQTNFEVIAPQGAGCHFLRYWGSVGLDIYDGNDVEEVGYDVIKHWENNPIIPKDSKEKEQVYRAETNEYISRVKNITMKHPWQFIFTEKDPKFDGKRIFVQCLEKDTEQFCIDLYFAKKVEWDENEVADWTNMAEGYHIPMKPHTLTQHIKHDMACNNAVVKRFTKLDPENTIILDYKKFFIDHNIQHIDQIADYFGFKNTKQTYELIKEYNRKNWEVYESNRLH
tara:strand:- start:261 stop:938 length:678 start_codon:yes stop_codon:yes gene_type:complete